MLVEPVLTWLADQPEWQRDLARRLATQVELTDEDYAEALGMVRHAYGIPLDSEMPAPRPLEPEMLAAADSTDRQRLLALGNLRGVGMVSEKDQIDFSPDGLTVIYGPNGVGKSSYVRTLKKLCRTVDRECVIRGNVHAEPTEEVEPSARVKIDGSSGLLELRTPLTGDIAIRLAGFSVFDARCAELYVNAQNVLEYIPPELRLLARLATLQDRFRRDLAAERETLARQQPALDQYPATSQLRAQLASLTGTAADPDLDGLAQLDDNQRRRLAELRAALAAMEASTARADAAAARRDATSALDLVSALSALAERAGAAAAARLRKAHAANDTATEAVRLAADRLVGPVPGIGGEPWELLWQAARDFVTSAGGTFPPPVGDHCPLCLQQVDSMTAERMAHFEAHITSTVQATAATAASEFDAAMQASAAEHAEAVAGSATVASLRDHRPDLASLVNSGAAQVAEHLRGMRANPAAANALEIDLEPTFAALREWADERSRRADALDAADDVERLPALRAELAELAARERLADDLERFTAWRKTLRTMAALERAHSALATNKITIAQRELTENEFCRDLHKALAEELSTLSCTLPVVMSTNTARAETSVGLRLANDALPVAEIASEGERRAVALSFYFAELSVASDASGIIVDDPVSSLDEDRREYIARRLVAEASQRQVIVFTHDLPFVLELQNKAEDAAVPHVIRGMWRLDDVVGRVDQHAPFKTMKLKDRIGNLRDRVARWDSEGGPTTFDEAWQRATTFYRDLRTAWERAVEERLFRGVVERFQKEVKTQSLEHVVVTKELITLVDEGMSRTSSFLHDEAAGGSGASLPNRGRVAADLALLEDFDKRVPADVKKMATRQPS